LGVDIKKFRIHTSDEPEKVRWAFESTSYVKKAILDIEKELENSNLKLLPNAKTPIASGYRPELDTSPELGSRQLNYYQGLIGVLRWICEIGRYLRRTFGTSLPYLRLFKTSPTIHDGIR
jgi:hypothetical protein